MKIDQPNITRGLNTKVALIEFGEFGIAFASKYAFMAKARQGEMKPSEPRK